MLLRGVARLLGQPSSLGTGNEPRLFVQRMSLRCGDPLRDGQITETEEGKEKAAIQRVERTKGDLKRLRPTEKGMRQAHERMQQEVRMEQRAIVEKFIQGAGPGGQKINKTSSAVFLKDAETGIIVKLQPTRDQKQNRALGRKRLQLKIDAVLHPEDGVLALKRLREQRRKSRHLQRWTMSTGEGDGDDDGVALE